MMRTAWLRFWIVVLLASANGLVLRAADDQAPPADPLPPANRPDPAALRERARNLSPEERQKMVREFREKHGLVGTNRPEWEQRREELKKLPPAEREAKLKELRQEIQQGRRQFKLLSTDEREAKRKELKDRIDAQISALQKQKTEGSISEPDKRRLARMLQMSARLERGGAIEARRLLPPKGPTASDTDVLPSPKPAPKPALEK